MSLLLLVHLHNLLCLAFKTKPAKAKAEQTDTGRVGCRTFFKGDEIAKQGAVPTDVVFLTSGAAMVTSAFKEEARVRKLDVMQLCPGRTVETVGLQIVAPNVEPHRWSLVSAEPSTSTVLPSQLV